MLQLSERGAQLDQNDSPRCERCAVTTQYVGGISMPAMMIYRCNACGNDMWQNKLRVNFVKSPYYDDFKAKNYPATTKG